MDFGNRNIAVLIDYENVAIANGEITRLIDYLSNRGRLIIKRAYGDWGRFAQIKYKMLQSSIDLIELPSNSSRKNQSDIRLVVDAMEIALTREYIDTFVLVSGDSDMSPLVAKLRELNRHVIVISKSDSTSSLLARCCDEFIEADSLTGQSEEIKLQLQEAEQLLIDAVQRMVSQGEKPFVSKLKTFMLRINPAFDHRSLGFSRFTKFLKSFAEQGLLKLIHNDDLQMEVSLSTKSIGSNSGSTMKMLEEELLDKIWWALKADQERWQDVRESDHPMKLSRLVQLVKRLFPEFDPHHYGFKLGAGYKKMMQTLEAFEYCELIYDHHRQLSVRWREEFLQRIPGLPEPVNFEKVASKPPTLFIDGKLRSDPEASIKNGSPQHPLTSNEILETQAKHILPMRQLTIQLFNDEDF